MAIEIDTEVVAEAIMEDHGFTSWLRDQIDERVPEYEAYELPYDVTRDSQLADLISEDDLPSKMRTAFQDHDASWFGIEGYGMDTTGDHVRQLLDTLPADSASRCALGRAFERAVVRVLDNVLRGDELHGVGRDGRVSDELIRVAYSRVSGTTPAYVSPSHTDDDVTERDESDVVSLIGQQVTCRDASHVHICDETCIDPVPVEPERTRYVREVMVLPINGSRDNYGTVLVHADASDTSWQVSLVGDDRTWTYGSPAAAFSRAFALGAWDVRSIEGRVD